MPRKVLTLLIFLACGRCSAAAIDGFDWSLWRGLPVQDGGRYKPLDSHARETAQLLIGRSSLTDPDSGRRQAALELYLTMLLDWKGWEASAGTAPGYFGPHDTDRWDRSAILHIDSLEFRNALGMPKDKRFIAPVDLLAARVRDPKTAQATSFPEWHDTLMASLRENKRKEKSLTEFERQGLDVGNRLLTFQETRMGRRLMILPVAGGRNQSWLSLSDLMGGAGKSGADAKALSRLQAEFAKVRSAYLAGDAGAFNAASADFVADVMATGQQLGNYPPLKTIKLEVAYNAYAPFRFSWILALTACLLALLSLGTGWRGLYWSALACSAGSLVAMAVGFGLRVAISGRAPVTNMYESIVYVGCGATVFGLIFELIYRKQFILVAASAVSTLALVLTDMAPALLDPSLQPLQPVLRSNYWLVIHVMTITLSYAAFALAWMIANIALGFYLFGSRDRSTIAALTTFTYRALQVGVVLLAAGTILGGVWAAYSWGRFWGWDPKEVWALVALLGYLAVLHARYAGWVADLGLAVCSVLCFSLVVMAWYGVNFVLGAGLHSYGFGGGGLPWVAGVLGVEFLYVTVASIRGTDIAAQHRRDRLAAEDGAEDRLDPRLGAVMADMR